MSYTGRGADWGEHNPAAAAAVLGVTRTAVVLGRPTRAGGWHAVGLSQPLPQPLATELVSLLDPAGESRELPPVVAGLPGRTTPISYQPTVVDTVVKVLADSAIEYGRWRHNPRILRIRGDLPPTDLSPLE